MECLLDSLKHIECKSLQAGSLPAATAFFLWWLLSKNKSLSMIINTHWNETCFSQMINIIALSYYCVQSCVYKHYMWSKYNIRWIVPLIQMFIRLFLTWSSSSEDNRQRRFKPLMLWPYSPGQIDAGTLHHFGLDQALQPVSGWKAPCIDDNRKVWAACIIRRAGLFLEWCGECVSNYCSNTMFCRQPH